LAVGDSRSPFLFANVGWRDGRAPQPIPLHCNASPAPSTTCLFSLAHLEWRLDSADMGIRVLHNHKKKKNKKKEQEGGKGKRRRKTIL
jgi:hypothetical protein